MVIMILIDKLLLEELMAKAEASERKRMNMDMRTSADDSSQRMLNALLPGTVVPVHRHPSSTESVICLSGCMDEVIFADDGKTEVERFRLCPADGKYGCVVPMGLWHTVEVFEPSVIFEAKDGKYGEDGSESCFG